MNPIEQLSNPDEIKAEVKSRLNSIRKLAAPFIRKAGTTRFELETPKRAIHTVNVDDDRLGDPGVAIGACGDIPSEDRLLKGKYQEVAYLGVFYPGYYGGTFDCAAGSRINGVMVTEYGHFDPNAKRLKYGFSVDASGGHIFVGLTPDKACQLQFSMISCESESGKMPQVDFTSKRSHRLLVRYEGKKVTGKADEAVGLLAKAGILVRFDGRELSVNIPGEGQWRFDTSELNLEYFLGKTLALGERVINDIQTSEDAAVLKRLGLSLDDIKR